MTDNERDLEDRFLRAGRADPWFHRHFKHKATRIVAKLVVVGLVFFAIGYGTSTLIGKASAAQPSTYGGYSCDPEPATPCGTAEAKWHVEKFKDGKMGRVHGFRQANFYRNVKRVRAAWVQVLIRQVKRFNAHHVHDYHYKGHRVDVSGASGRVIAARDDGSISPYEFYGMAVDNTTCVGTTAYPAWRTGTNYCSHTGIRSVNTHGLTKSQVQNGGAAVFCGGAVAFGVGGAPLTEGGTLFIAAWGAAACGWGLWMASDPG